MNELLINDAVVIAVASELDVRAGRTTRPFLTVRFATEVDEPFVWETMEVAGE